MDSDNPGIYIHIPFCSHKCNYCDFYLITNLNIIDRFLMNLRKEMELCSYNYRGIKFNSVFIGGGTPSLLTGAQIDSLLKTLKKNYNISEKSEITIETNPENFILDKNKFSEYRDAGINRISFGIQSFNDDELKFLTREHTSAQAIDVIHKAQKYFDNISIDLIYSLPGHKLKSLEYTLNTAISLDIPHISAYTLIYEEETPVFNLLKRNKINQTDDKTESDLYLLFSEKLKKSGYNHYEVSNYAKAGYESQHNLKYWEYENYLGFGPSAHSFWNGKRWNNCRNIIKYNINLQRNELPIENEYTLSIEEMKTEFIMLGLRSKGVNLNTYKKIFGKDFQSEFTNQIKELIDNGDGFFNKEYFSLNERGYLLADEICAKYF